MAILIQRFRLRLVWLLTRHPKFRPIYHRDVVSADLMEQAEFLASAGYYVAAVMLARLAVESRLKRLALISRHWKNFGKKPPVCTIAHKLHLHGRINVATKRNIEAMYERASRVVHGDQIAAERCLEVLGAAAGIVDTLDAAITQYARSCSPVIVGSVKGGAA